MGPGSVFVGEYGGWVRIFLNDDHVEGTLMYLHESSTVSDVSRELTLSDRHTIWMRIQNEKSAVRLKKSDKLLDIQDEILRRIGYDDASRRARLATDFYLTHVVKFYVGTNSNFSVAKSGFTWMLRGLVVPQWKSRMAVILADKLFLFHDGGGGKLSDAEKIELSGCEIKSGESFRWKRHILRIIGKDKRLFLAFDTPWEKKLWKRWLLQASALDDFTASGDDDVGGGRSLDLSETGLERVPDSLALAWPALHELTLSRNPFDEDEACFEPLRRLTKLNKLILRQVGFTTLPSTLTKLSQLQFLDLSDNAILILPKAFRNLNELRELRLDRNQLADISEIRHLLKLVHFSVCDNRLINESLQRAMKHNENGDARDLKTLNLRGNILKGTVQLANYGVRRNLAEVDVSENSLEILDFLSLSNLERIKCCKNQLNRLSLNGTKLRSIIAGNNKLKSLSVKPLPADLEHLDVSFNEMELLPEWISRCDRLQTILASHNRLVELPQDLFCNEESALHTLQLSFNQLTTLPQVMRRVPLQQLFLHSNSLTNLPRHFFVASSCLKILNVSKNCLKELPQFISKNENLNRLYLTSNALTDITPLLNCVGLRMLHVAYNAIATLPEGCISAWKEMEELVLCGNSLSSFPEQISNWRHLRILRIHSNLIASCPNFSNNAFLKILDLSYNYLERIDLSTLLPKQLRYLDISGNSRIYVDPKQFQLYRARRGMSLVDVSGNNRSMLPTAPSSQQSHEGNSPWSLGFSETTGQMERLCVSQLRLQKFCNMEALIGIFDAMNNAEVPKLLEHIIPRILLEERSVKETCGNYMKYTMLSARRELKEYSYRSELYATLCHICSQKVSAGGGLYSQRYILRIATLGDTKSVLCRNSEILTLSPPQSGKNHYGNSSESGVMEITLQDSDQFLLLANKSLWEVMSVEEAVAEVQSMRYACLGAKRLQDLAQSYGCQDNISVLVLKFNAFNQDGGDSIVKELHQLADSRDKTNSCFCDFNDIQRLTADSERSSPSGQSDKHSMAKAKNNFTENMEHYRKAKKYVKNSSCDRISKPYAANGKSYDGYANGDVADSEESSSERSGQTVPEERYRCWEYMLEKNTQMLFDKELDTLSKSFVKNGALSRPALWSHRAKSVSHLPDCTQPLPFLSKNFGSTRSYHPPRRFDLGRRSLNGGPNAAYFGSLQRLMPYPIEYDFSEIKEKFDSTLDSLEIDGRMHRYWDVATTEL